MNKPPTPTPDDAIRAIAIECSDAIRKRFPLTTDSLDNAQAVVHILDAARRIATITNKAESKLEDGFKRRVIDALICNHILTSEHETNPERALTDLIAWETKIALDPAISSEADQLQKRYAARVVRELIPVAAKNISTALEGGDMSELQIAEYMELYLRAIIAAGTPASAASRSCG